MDYDAIDPLEPTEPRAFRPPRAEPPRGVAQVRVPTGFPVGDVNVWLLRDPVTLVDCGPHRPEAERALAKGLEDHGVSLADVEQIVLTHYHMDHSGLAATVKRESGCDVWCLGEDARIVEEWNERVGKRNEEYRDGLLLAGVPEDVLGPIGRDSEEIDAVMQPCPGVKDLGPLGTVAAGGRHFEVVPAPGHTAGSFLLLADDIAVTGDTLLPHITPNAIHVRRAEWGALSTYLSSLAALKERRLGDRVALPGHGPAFRDADRVVERGLVHHRERAARVEALLAKGPRRVWDVARILFPDAGREAGVFLAVSEAFGHLEHLVAEKRAQRVERDGVLEYRVA